MHSTHLFFLLAIQTERTKEMPVLTLVFSVCTLRASENPRNVFWTQLWDRRCFLSAYLIQKCLWLFCWIYSMYTFSFLLLWTEIQVLGTMSCSECRKNKEKYHTFWGVVFLKYTATSTQQIFWVYKVAKLVLRIPNFLTFLESCMY